MALLSGFFLARSATSQTKEPSASDLIKFLTYQSEDRSRKPSAFRCGLLSTDRGAARSLARLGVSAVSDIEQALDSIEEGGEESRFAFNSE